MRHIHSFVMAVGIGRLMTVALLTTCALGCSSSDTPVSSCTAGDKLACSCATGGSGYRICEAISTWGACDCSATLPSSTDAATIDGVQDTSQNAIDGVPVATSGLDGATVDVQTVAVQLDGPTSPVPLYSPCTTDGECDSGFCFLYNNGNRRCTKTCVTSAECPAPSSGCNAKGVCKDPS
jgi:hypothetical protein